MNSRNFSHALGNVSESYVDEAAAYNKGRRKSAWIKWASMAACLCLIFASVLLLHILRSPDASDEDGPVTSYFVISALAADGESTDLMLTDGFLNSIPAQGKNVFGVDMPLFNFSVTPSDLDGNEAVYDRFDISVSYNGSTVSVTDKDEHISIAYIYNRLGNGRSCAWSIFGWFTEPTDVIVHVLDRESREIVEVITVNVNYLADKQEYELKVTNLTTKFSEQKEAVEASNVLMSILIARNGTDYPEWFGGCYIKDNKLHVRLVSPSDEEMEDITEWLASFGDVIVYEDAEASMSDLQEYADKTANALMENGYAVTSWYVDSVTGNIVISVLESDLEAATAWVNATAQNGKAPKIIVEIGEYTVPTGKTTEFCAEPFLQNNGLSWMYSINVKIDNGDIYLNEILYDQISYVEDLDLDFSSLGAGPYLNANITEELDRIKSQKGCYMLETQSEGKYGKKIAMYVIGDTYYFIRFFDSGSIMRIHSGTSK